MDTAQLESHLFRLGLVKIDLCNRGLPIEITQEIVNPAVKLVRKLICQYKERDHAFMGESKSAMKRRSKRLKVCLGCGKYIHVGKCKWSTTHAQDFKKYLTREGTIKVLCETERSLPKSIYKETEAKCLIRETKLTYRYMLDNLDNSIRKTLGNLSLKDP
ncbi:nucleic acid binding protein [Karelinia prunevirus A]|nr:nucleic acid binding protein [Karelinia prunevirus A]